MTHETRPDGFERTFTVDLAPDDVWQAVARPVPDAAQPEAGGAATHYLLPGFEARCSVLEQDVGRLLRVRKDEEPCSGTEIVVRLEHAGSGTKVTVVQSGFGPWLPDVIETFGMVWNMIVADLKLYLERRISIKTHLFSQPPPSLGLGCKTQDELSGLTVAQVEADGFAARAGIRQGDLLLELNGARLLNELQLMDLMRMCSAGSELQVRWARGRDLMQGRASL